MRTPLSSIVLLSLFCALSGCDDQAGDNGPDAGLSPACLEMAAGCLENQQVCVEGPMGAACEACPAGHYAGLVRKAEVAAAEAGAASEIARKQRATVRGRFREVQPAFQLWRYQNYFA